VVWSFLYVALCRLLQLLVLLGRSERSKELEILVLRHELAIFRRQSRRARLRPLDRAILAPLARALPRSALGSLSARPATLLRWHRELVKRRGRIRTDGRRGGRRSIVEYRCWLFGSHARTLAGVTDGSSANCEASASVFQRLRCGRSSPGAGCRRRGSETSCRGETFSASRRRRRSHVISSRSRPRG
jgi:hypothetical protein